MNRVVRSFRWNDLLFQQQLGDLANIVGQLEQWNALQEAQPRHCHLLIPFTAFVDDGLRSHQVKLMTVPIPPLFRKDLARSLHEACGRPSHI